MFTDFICVIMLIIFNAKDVKLSAKNGLKKNILVLPDNNNITSRLMLQYANEVRLSEKKLIQIHLNVIA